MKRLPTESSNDNPAPPPDFEEFREGVDNWMKHVSAALVAVGNDLQSCAGTINNNVEDVQFLYENQCRIEQKVDRIEADMQRLKLLLDKIVRSPPVFSPALRRSPMR